MQRPGQLFANPRSRTDCVRDRFANVDCSSLRTVRGQSASTVTVSSRTIEVVACARTRIVRGHDCRRGLNANTDCAWTWKVPVRVPFMAESSPWTGRCHVREWPLSRGQSALPPRLIRGRRILVSTRGRACPVLNMMRNTLPPLLQHLVTPVFKLRGDSFNAGDLFGRSHFDAPGVVNTERRFRHLHHGMFGMGIEPFAKFIEHFDGSADLSGGGCLHNQMRMPREGL